MSSAGIAGMKKGDSLILITQTRNPETVTVSRVGRTWVYVADANERELQTRFDAVSGAEDPKTVTVSGGGKQLVTQAQYDEHTLRVSIVGKLHTAGITFTHDAPRMSTARLQAILDAATAEE